MLSLSKELFKQCRKLLLQCSELDEAHALEAMFVFEGLSILQSNLPVGNTKVDRVDKLIAYLIQNESINHPPYLLLFLEALQDKRDEGDLLQKELGELISDIRDSWQSASEKLRDKSPTISKHTREDWDTALREQELYGRSNERETLRSWLVNQNARVVAVVGIGGVGKTTLAARVAQDVREHFDHIFWRDLRNAPLPDDLLTECILFLSHHKEINIPETLDGKIQLLGRYLATSKCLIVLDNAETVLGGRENAGEFRPHYEGYGDLLRMASRIQNESCIMLTTRETPADFSYLEKTIGGVYKLFLSGLEEAAGIELLKQSNLAGSTNLWVDLIKLYGGNPLALKLVAATIRDWFEGDVNKFLEHGIPVYGTLKDLLEEQVNRLSSLGAEILFWLAIERETITLTDLESDIVYWLALNGNPASVQSLKYDIDGANQVSRRSIMEAVDSLDRKSLIEKNQGRFTLQPVIMEHITEKLVEELFREINSKETKLLRSHAIIKAQSKEYVRLSQVRLVLDPLCHMLLTSLGKERLRDSLNNIIELSRATDKRSTGYLAGNTLNILSNINEPTIGFDFSDLDIRQAFLHSTDLRKTDFSRARFKDTFFTEAFANVACVSTNESMDLFAAGMGNGEVRIWKAPDWTQIASTSFSNTWIRTLSFNSKRNLLAGSGDDGTIKIWDWENNYFVQSLLGHTNRVRSLVFTQDGNSLISGSEDGSIRFWDLTTGVCTATLDIFRSPIRSIALSSSGSLLAIGGAQNSIVLYNLEQKTNVRVLQGHDKAVWRVKFNSDGHLLASASEDKTIRIWDIDSGECLKTLEGHQEWVRDVSFDKTGTILISCGDDQTVRAWDIKSGEQKQSMLGHSNRVQATEFVVGDGTQIVSGSDDHSIRIWDIQTGRCLKVLHGYTNPIWGCAFEPGVDRLATGSADGFVRLWNIETMKCELVLRGHTKPVWSVQFIQGQNLLISGGDDGNIILWDLETGNLNTNLAGHKSWVRSVAVSNDGNYFASGGADFEVKLWDLRSRRLLKTLSLHKNRVDAVAFNYKADLLASGGEDNAIIIWDVKTGESQNLFSEHTAWVRSLAFSPVSNILVSGSDDKSLRVWDIATGTSEVLLGHTGRVRAVAFSNDGKLVASGGSDNVVRIWDIENLKCLAVLTGHTAGIRSLSISRQSSLLASCGEDGQIIIWDIPAQKIISQLTPERPYEGMIIDGVKGLSPSQISSLSMLGAISKNT